MFDQLAKSVLEVFTGTQADKDRAQEQLKPVLEQRFRPCLDLWPHLWAFLESAEPNEPDVDALLGVVNDFLRQHGAVLSVPFFDALLELRSALGEAKTGDELVRSVMIGAVKSRHLMPSTRKDAKGNEVARPGVVLLLRDEIEANARSASSAVKN